MLIESRGGGGNHPTLSYGKAELIPKSSKDIHSSGKEPNLHFKVDLLKAGK